MSSWTQNGAVWDTKLTVSQCGTDSMLWLACFFILSLKKNDEMSQVIRTKLGALRRLNSEKGMGNYYYYNLGLEAVL